jgi:chemotaxis signal transduction protein
MEFIHIIVNSQNYLINSERIKEILKYPNIKPLAESSEYIKGIISHKDKIIPILEVRKLLGFDSFEAEQIKLLNNLKKYHISWIDEYESSLKEDKPFTKALDPHKCELGMWIDETLRCMRCNHEGYTDIIKNSVVPYHNALHNDGKEFLDNPDQKSIEKQIESIKEHGTKTIEGLKKLEDEIDRLCKSFEQLIICDIDGIDVGFIVDSVAGLHQLDEKNFNLGTEPLSRSSKFIHFIDHYESEDELMFSMKFTNALTTIVETWREKEIA